MRWADLTEAERLRLHRDRLGQTQKEVASKYGVSLGTYKRWEQGRSVPVALVQQEDPSERERAVILRRRQGVRQTEIARELGVARNRVIRMESGKSDPELLVRYWRERA